MLQSIPTHYRDSQSLFEAIRAGFKKDKHVEFYGTYNMPADPLVTDKERVDMIVHEIWKVTGYRFTYGFIMSQNNT